ncbi:MAG: polynucleotide adenylyltransferase PcnB [Gammaproteobacteria bacterium]|nr:polynucleotide adenylyltransferase PcnB [Gammaproteobacteria bacterium]
MPTEDAKNSKVIIERPDHNISRSRISPNALKVLYRLHNAGYQAFLVGGGVRDLLLGLEPKDFDIATDASPEQVNDLFRNARMIGRRFKLVHVRFGREIIEVATFRAQQADEDHPELSLDDSGRILRDNVYGTLEEDAFRRDFTVNALYYNIADFSVVDHVAGVPDLDKGLLRLIGDPETRYREDPVRMLRAVRFAAKLGFRIEKTTAAPIAELAPLLRDIPPARLFEEILKLFLAGKAVDTWEQLRDYGLMQELFPLTEKAFQRDPDSGGQAFVARALKNTDERISDDKPVSPFFLFAAFLWDPVQQQVAELEKSGCKPAEALHIAADEVTSRQQQFVALPKRFAVPMREVWQLQSRFRFKSGKRALSLLGHPRFRAAYDFMLLRAEVGEVDLETAQFWTDVQVVDGPKQREMLSAPSGSDGGSRGGGRRRGGRSRRRGGRGGKGNND